MKPLQPEKIRAAQRHAGEELAEDGGLAYSNSKVPGEFCRDENDGEPKDDAGNRICVTVGVRLRTDNGGHEQNRTNDKPPMRHGHPST